MESDVRNWAFLLVCSAILFRMVWAGRPLLAVVLTFGAAWAISEDQVWDGMVAVAVACATSVNTTWSTITAPIAPGAPIVSGAPGASWAPILFKAVDLGGMLGAVLLFFGGCCTHRARKGMFLAVMLLLAMYVPQKWLVPSECPKKYVYEADDAVCCPRGYHSVSDGAQCCPVGMGFDDDRETCAVEPDADPARRAPDHTLLGAPGSATRPKPSRPAFTPLVVRYMDSITSREDREVIKEIARNLTVHTMDRIVDTDRTTLACATAGVLALALLARHATWDSVRYYTWGNPVGRFVIAMYAITSTQKLGLIFVTTFCQGSNDLFGWVSHPFRSANPTCVVVNEFQAFINTHWLKMLLAVLGAHVNWAVTWLQTPAPHSPPPVKSL